MSVELCQELAPTPLTPDPVGAFAGLEEYRGALTRFLGRKLHDENDVHDLVQETLLRGARYRRGELETWRLRGWLFRIASNLHADFCRRRAISATTGHDPATLDSPQLGTVERGALMHQGEPLDWETGLSLLRQARKDLSPSDRRVLAGFYEQRQKTSSLASELSIAQSMVKVRLFRARRRLRRRMEQALAPLVRQQPCLTN